MAIRLDVYKTQRLHLVRFGRAVTGPPSATYPDLDDRGYVGEGKGPVVGLPEGSMVGVQLMRQQLSDSAPLWVSSSDPATVALIDPSKGQLPAEPSCIIYFQGVKGGEPAKAKIRVHFGSSSGPIIHELTVFVFKPITLDITPHIVDILEHGTSRGITSLARVPDLMKIADTIWRPCGIRLRVGDIESERISLRRAGFVDVDYRQELVSILSLNPVPKTLNVYFVHSTAYWGLAISRKICKSFGNQPGVIVADQAGETVRANEAHWGQTLAHEIGHFLGLPHVEQRNSDNPCEDSWSRRMLMFPITPLPKVGKSGRYVYSDLGYGECTRGCLITQKHLSQCKTDNECFTARSTMSVLGPY